MNAPIMVLEAFVVLLGLAVLLADLWTPPSRKRNLGLGAAAGLGFVLLFSFSSYVDTGSTGTAFGGMFLMDPFALFFKRFFLVAAAAVLLLSVDYADRLSVGVGEYFALVLFALSGMMFASSANDLSVLFVSIELITVTFYVLISYQRGRVSSLEAGVKYLILGALSSAVLVFGIALVIGVTGKTAFPALLSASSQLGGQKVFLMGVLMITVALGFKIAAFPFQMWAPDVYQGAPLPTLLFLAAGSKAAGFALLLRVLFSAVPPIVGQWQNLLAVCAALTILYGNLCAIPQRNIKRLLGYSSIANAGYLLLGVAALSHAGGSAILFYLGAYLASLVVATAVAVVVLKETEAEDLSALAGLHQRSPFLAGALAVSVVSLAGVPPLAGFFGKFLLLKAVIAEIGRRPEAGWLLGVALLGIVSSFYYYFQILKATYSSRPEGECPPLRAGRSVLVVAGAGVAAVIWIGVAPGALLEASARAAAVFGR
jgi:NADH-quinone oxidoreductase subunit N